MLCVAPLKIQTKKLPKFTICAPSHNFVELYLHNQGTYRQSEKNLLDSNISPSCPHNMFSALRPTGSWHRFVSLGHPSEFQRVSRLGFITGATSLNGSQPNFARCLAISWAGTLYIHFQGLLSRNEILQGTKFTLRPPKSCILLYWQRYCMALE